MNSFALLTNQIQVLMNDYKMNYLLFILRGWVKFRRSLHSSPQMILIIVIELDFRPYMTHN